MALASQSFPRHVCHCPFAACACALRVPASLRAAWRLSLALWTGTAAARSRWVSGRRTRVAHMRVCKNSTHTCVCEHVSTYTGIRIVCTRKGMINLSRPHPMSSADDASFMTVTRCCRRGHVTLATVSHAAGCSVRLCSAAAAPPDELLAALQEMGAFAGVDRAKVEHDDPCASTVQTLGRRVCFVVAGRAHTVHDVDSHAQS
jgi:hypothetical protein